MKVDNQIECIANACNRGNDLESRIVECYKELGASRIILDVYKATFACRSALLRILPTALSGLSLQEIKHQRLLTAEALESTNKLLDLLESEIAGHEVEDSDLDPRTWSLDALNANIAKTTWMTNYYESLYNAA